MLKRLLFIACVLTSCSKKEEVLTPEVVITYRVETANLKKPCQEAVDEWNYLFKDKLQFKEVKASPDIIVMFGFIPEPPTEVIGKYINNTAQKYIILSNKVTWAMTTVQTFTTNHEDLFACLVHEFGHAAGLPHFENPDYVMHPLIGGFGNIDGQEARDYLQYYLEHH